MRVIFHPEFPKDIQKFAQDYRAISDGLSTRFRQDVDDALEAVKLSPSSAGQLSADRFHGRDGGSPPQFTSLSLLHSLRNGGRGFDRRFVDSKSNGPTDLVDTFRVVSSRVTKPAASLLVSYSPTLGVRLPRA